jgi:uncharacterized protein involved in exopolysaccharide biosynthesis
MSNQEAFKESSVDDIDISEIFNLIWRFKYLLISSIIVFGLLSVSYSLTLPNIYTSSAVMKTTDSAGDSSDSGGAVGSLAQMAGLNLSPSAATGSKSDLAVATILSRDFLKHLLNFPKFAANIYAVDKYDKASKKISYNDKIYDSENDTWKIDEPSYVELYKDYVDMLDTSFEKKTGYITIKLQHQSPFVAEELLSLIIREANLLARARDKQQSTDSLEYLTNQLDLIQQKDIKLSINQLIGVEMRKLTLVNIEENYLIEPIDSPFIPHIKTHPARARISIIGTIAGFVATLFLLILWYLIAGRKREI